MRYILILLLISGIALGEDTMVDQNAEVVGIDKLDAPAHRCYNLLGGMSVCLEGVSRLRKLPEDRKFQKVALTYSGPEEALKLLSRYTEYWDLDRRELFVTTPENRVYGPILYDAKGIPLNVLYEPSGKADAEEVNDRIRDAK